MLNKQGVRRYGIPPARASITHHDLQRLEHIDNRFKRLVFYNSD